MDAEISLFEVLLKWLLAVSANPMPHGLRQCLILSSQQLCDVVVAPFPISQLRSLSFK